VKTNITSKVEDLHCALNHRDWTLEIAKQTPDCFQLLYQAQPVFTGQFEVTNNSTPLNLSSVLWRFRIKENQFEQWCNIQLNASISISMTYSFRRGALVIDYLARSGVPTRLDIRHRITQVDLSYKQDEETNDVLSALQDWEHERDDRPSSYLLESNERVFREAFSSTQWVVLEQKCDVANRT